MVVKVLLVEDDCVLCEVFSDILLLGGYEFVVVDLVEVVLLVLVCEVFSLVISDVNMLGMDGYQLFGLICICYLYLLVLLMIVYGVVDCVVEVMCQGVVDYLVKLFEVWVLFDLVVCYVLGQLLGSEEDGLVVLELVSWQLLELVVWVVCSDFIVLIFGEFGIGKEVLVNYIYQ